MKTKANEENRLRGFASKTEYAGICSRQRRKGGERKKERKEKREDSVE